MVSYEQRIAEDRSTPATRLTLHKIFEAQAWARPDAPAILFGREAVTYGELDESSNRLARYLRRHGVERGGSVAIMLPRSIDAYVSILAALKSGAAYVPIDPAYPEERIAWMLADCGAGAILNASELENHRAEIAAESAKPLTVEGDADTHDLCYVIYTSGSTGRPKGVMVEHRNAVHLVEAEGRIFGVQPCDRVYQGASLCFDLSVEEMWLAFRAGATLIAATPEMTQSGPDLSRYLTEAGVTVLSCVPTLLSMLEGEVPTLRLLILGGERCTGPLVARWAREGRRIVNTYGPTETTVIATYAELCPGKPITIGRPAPGYDVYILDSDLRPVSPGETGEICIGGAGVARGYVGLREETRSRFITIAQSTRIYRSGDLGRMNSHGQIEFVGRADGQVKLRGLRIELGEIELAMLRADGIRAAACAVRTNAHAEEQLIGYVVPREGCAIDEECLRTHLRASLPSWMIPSRIETIFELPHLPNGKLDRAALPAPTPREKTTKGRAASTETERRLLEVWNALFRPHTVGVDDDFFLELGGHSLLAAHMVSDLRKDAKFACLTMRDIYSHPTIFKLAFAIDAASPPVEQAPDTSPRPDEATQRQQHFIAGAIQTICLYFVFGFRGIQWLTPYMVWFLVARQGSPLAATLWALASGMALLPSLVLIAVCVKWMVLGRIQPGRHRLWGAWYLRWWFVQSLVRSVPLGRLGGTPLLSFVYRLFGARIGPNVHISSDQIAAFDVVSIGDGSSIDEGASLAGYTMEDGYLVIGPIAIGRRCFVGTGSVLAPGCAMEDGARLEDLSLLMTGTRIPAGQTWTGSPPRRTFRAPSPSEPRPSQVMMRSLAVIALYALLACILPLVELFAFVPGVLILTRLSWFAAPLAGASFILSMTSITVCLKRLLIGRARAGSYPVHGWFYMRNWVVEQLLALGVDVAGPLHATLFLKPWYRALGVRLGRFAEVSTASVTTPDLLEIGDDCTIADEVSLGAARVEGGWLTLAPTKLGRRVFVGNNAVVPAGTTLADETLIGVMTVAPSESRRNSCWLGSPPIPLPRREAGRPFGEAQTFRPGAGLQWARGIFEILRVTLPGAVFILVTVAVLETALGLWQRWGPAATLLSLPLLFSACCAAAILAVPIVKWIVMGRYRRFAQPFWSGFVWRLEFVNALFEFMATPIGLEALRGTPLLPWYLRLLGSRIGRRVWIDTTGFLEFDLVEIGDRVILNKDCILQTHLFEDRVLKGAGLRIGPDCEIGTRSIVLYDTAMEEHARLGPLSLLMKGESLRSGKVWIGSPLSGCQKEGGVSGAGLSDCAARLGMTAEKV